MLPPDVRCCKMDAQGTRCNNPDSMKELKTEIFAGYASLLQMIGAVIGLFKNNFAFLVKYIRQHH